MIMLWPEVLSLKCLRSAGKYQSSWLSFPIALFSPMATIIETVIGSLSH
jgi:hypothetical protein